MLLRRRVITPATEREVVVVKPRRPAGLYAALGTATLCAVGLIGYLSYAIFQDGQNDGENQTAAVSTPSRTDGRAQRFERMNQPVEKPSTTIIVNPPAIIHTPPPVVQPVKPPETPIIVNGSSEPDSPPAKTPPPDDSNSDSNSDENPPTDVDGTIRGSGE